MSAFNESPFPPNPYKLSPIRSLELLGGRSSETRTIRYYLGLTASGQNPHLALIGQRGVGKTSLLNGAECIARELKLLPVRIDMNELKAKSPGRFWHDLYQSLALAMVKAGCWGGIQGAIYGELLQMLHSARPGNLQSAVLQIPFVYSCHRGEIDSVDCPDSLIVSDFEACVTELTTNGYTGIVLLIDEADCIGTNVPLLQMFRNVFQVVEHCSLMLAGTDAVFPALSEVFSPIPRQFHRVDVKPFGSLFDTVDLILLPIRAGLQDKAYEAVAPAWEVMEDLHELCGGAPDEVQLYCHHMYRSIEEKRNGKMDLSPQVFRRVLSAYRSNTPANVDAVLNAIERLPDRLLFESKWLSRRELSAEENIQVTLLSRSLVAGRVLENFEQDAIREDIVTGYQELFEAGILEGTDRVRLAGAPLTAGFWKSFVNVERGKRWAWDDRDFAAQLRRPIVRAIGVACGAAAVLEKDAGDNALQALEMLRSGASMLTVSDFAGWTELIFTARLAREKNASQAVDLILQADSPAGRQTSEVRLLQAPDKEIERESVDAWLEAQQGVLSAHGISLAILSFTPWTVPSSDEVHRLGRISGTRVPSLFGADGTTRAVQSFNAGDIEAAANEFACLLADKEDDVSRNNLGFCQILLGRATEARSSLERAIEQSYSPLYELNLGIAQFLLGERDLAIAALQNSLAAFEAPGKKYDPAGAIFVLLLEDTVRRVWYLDGLPIDAAVLLNLYKMQAISARELETGISARYPDKYLAWLATVGVTPGSPPVTS